LQDTADWVLVALLCAAIALGGLLGWRSRGLGRRLGPVGGTFNRVGRAILTIGLTILGLGMIAPAIRPSLAHSDAYINWFFGIGFGLAVTGVFVTVFTRPSKSELRRLRRKREREERAKRKQQVT